MRKLGDHVCASGVSAWIDTVDSQNLYLSVITVMEVELGIARLERRDTAQATMLRRWVRGQVMPAFGTNILPIDAAIAVRCAQLHVPDPKSERDGWIAATGLVHDMTIVTRNVADFVATGASLLDPWTHGVR